MYSMSASSRHSAVLLVRCLLAYALKFLIMFSLRYKEKFFLYDSNILDIIIILESLSSLSVTGERTHFTHIKVVSG